MLTGPYTRSLRPPFRPDKKLTMMVKSYIPFLIVALHVALVLTVDIDQLAKDIAITYDVDRHNPPSPVYGNSFLANISLANVGNNSIPASGWSLYFCHNPLIQPLYYNTTAAQYFGGGLILSGNITLTHVKGCMFKFEPYVGTNPAYQSQPLGPGETRNVSFLSSNTAVSRYDVYPNWYLSNGTHTAIIQNTKNDVPLFVTPHNTFLKWMRSVPTDLYGTPLGLWNRYTGYNFTAVNATKYSVIPTPLEQKLKTGKVNVNNKWSIDRDRDGRLAGVATYLKKSISGITIKNKKRGSKDVIQLYIRRNRPATESPERYLLRVKSTPPRIEIGGNTVHGVFNGIQTLFSLLAFDGTVQEMEISDEPRFPYRGVMLDVASNFYPKSTVIKLLNVMALYKLNKLQLKLANNEGWRIEVPDIPELAQIGGRRCHDHNETTCLFTQFGSGPDNTTSGSGFYTGKDYMDILKAAKRRHIEIIPWINFGGKSRAAIVSMKSYEKRTGDQSMRIFDPADDVHYMTEDLYSDAVINPCIPTVDAFFTKILKTMIGYHARAKSPLTLINVGGHDVPAATRINSTYCNSLNLTGPDPFMLMKVNYTTRLANISSTLGVNFGGVEDFFSAWPTNDERGGILVPFSRTRFPGNIDLYPVLTNSFDPMTFQRAQVMANVGYKVILSPADYVSLDHAPEPDPNIPGAYWAIRHIQATRVFNYLPDNRCCNLNPDEFRYGKFTPNGCIDTDDCVPLDYPGNITGMQAHILTPKIRSEEHLFGLMFPRLLAFAERAWHKADWESSYVGRFNRSMPFVPPNLQAQNDDWVRFASIVGHKELRRLEAYTILHRIPPPGVHVDPQFYDPFDSKNKSVILTDVQYPGLVPQVYGANGQWADLGPITDITNLTISTLTFRTRNAAGNRFSEMEGLDLKVPNAYMAQLIANGIMYNPRLVSGMRRAGPTSTSKSVSTSTPTTPGVTLSPTSRKSSTKAKGKVTG
ncbi:putative beta-hexosaminidase [Pecten maximus]|uniref:putative beta-hexosaminidase n=1 Tax=Pecten maximus TaxID=6579 RepID=UPI0014581734|nr:putative beta-hexosaminidase [Pecten maximus]